MTHTRPTEPPRGFARCTFPGCAVHTKTEHLAAHEASHYPADEITIPAPTVGAYGAAGGEATERPTEAVYPIPRPESGEDARFTTGLWIEVLDVIERHGYPRMSGPDMARLQSMLFDFIYQPPNYRTCGKDELHDWHDWPDVAKGGVFTCLGIPEA